MIAAPTVGPVSTFVQQRLRALLDRKRVVVWYDAERAFGELVRRLELPSCSLVRVEESAYGRGRAAQPTTGGEQVSISYRSTRFTSSVLGLKLLQTSMFSASLAVRLEAFDGPGQNASAVGQAAQRDARDPLTGAVLARLSRTRSSAS